MCYVGTVVIIYDPSRIKQIYGLQINCVNLGSHTTNNIKKK